MASAFEIEKSEQVQALYAYLDADEQAAFRRMIGRVDAASLMPEQKMLIVLTVAAQLGEALSGGKTFAAVVGDENAFIDRAIQDIGEDVRQQRHIGALTAGLAICAVILLLRSALDLIMGIAGGTAFGACQTQLDVGHVIALIAILLSTRLLVAGDKKASYNDPKKATRRLQLVGFAAIVALLALALPFFGKYVILVLPSAAVAGFALVLLILWKLSARL